VGEPNRAEWYPEKTGGVKRKKETVVKGENAQTAKSTDPPETACGEASEQGTQDWGKGVNVET